MEKNLKEIINNFDYLGLDVAVTSETLTITIPKVLELVYNINPDSTLHYKSRTIIKRPKNWKYDHLEDLPCYISSEQHLRKLITYIATEFKLNKKSNIFCLNITKGVEIVKIESKIRGGIIGTIKTGTRKGETVSVPKQDIITGKVKKSYAGRDKSEKWDTVKGLVEYYPTDATATYYLEVSNEDMFACFNLLSGFENWCCPYEMDKGFIEGDGYNIEDKDDKEYFEDQYKIFKSMLRY